jgi:hypothetical protein
MSVCLVTGGAALILEEAEFIAASVDVSLPAKTVQHVLLPALAANEI